MSGPRVDVFPRVKNRESRFISIALASWQRRLDPPQAVTHVRELMLEMFEPVENRLAVA
jgi:hypothetical protein